MKFEGFRLTSVSIRIHEHHLNIFLEVQHVIRLPLMFYCECFVAAGQLQASMLNCIRNGTFIQQVELNTRNTHQQRVLTAVG